MKEMKHLFTSERLGFRNWMESDKSLYAAMNLDPEVMRFFPSIPAREISFGVVDKFSKHFEKYGFTYFAVDHLEDQNFIGFIGMMHQEYESPYSPFIDIGWRLRKAYWGKGLATEGAKTCMEFAKNKLNITSIHSVATWNNAPSMNIMKKIGMEKIGEFIHPSFDAEHELQPCWVFRN